MPTDAGREMTLREWVDRLPASHRARRELDALEAERDTAAERLAWHEQGWSKLTADLRAVGVTLLPNSQGDDDFPGQIVRAVQGRNETIEELRDTNRQREGYWMARVAELEAERDDLRAATDSSRIGWDRLADALRESGHWDGRSPVNIGQRAREVIAELEDERRWVPVGERLPPADAEVLLWFRDADTRPTTPSHEALGYWIDIGEDYPMWVAPYPWDTQKPVFWMPKPKQPEATDAD